MEQEESSSNDDEQRNAVLERVKKNGMNLKYEDDKWKSDELVVLTSIEQNVESFQFASKDLRNEFLKQCVMIDRRVLLHASEQLLRDEQFMMDCFMMDDSLRTNVDFLWKVATVHTSNFKHVLILKCIELSGASFLERVPTELRNDPKFMMRAVEQNKECIQFASETLLNDEQFQSETNKIQDETCVSSLTETEKIELEKNQAIDDARTYGAYFLVLNDKWKNNERVVLAAVKNERSSLYDLRDSELTKNTDFLMGCTKYNANYLKFVSEQQRNDEEFMLQCVKLNREALDW